MPVQVGKLTVRTVQRGAGHDAGFRVRTESLVRSLDLQPPGLPERTILVVRRMELAQIDATTAHRARAALADLRRRAARPLANPVDASAGAVLFANQVELLTCLTSDLMHGAAGGRWYWREIIPTVSARGIGGGAGLADAWIPRVRWLPASLARLPEPVAQRVVSLLSEPDVSRVLRALLAEFAVDARPASLSPPGPPTSASGHRRSADPPWRRWLPATTLRPDAEALLGVALSLHHAPALVRRPRYAGHLAAWWASANQAARPTAAPGEAPAPGAASGEAFQPGVPAADRSSAGAAPGGGPPLDAPPRADPLGEIQSTDSRPARAERPAYRSPAPASTANAGTAAATTIPISSGALGDAPAPEPDGAACAPALDRLRPSGPQARRAVPPEPLGDSDMADFGTTMSRAEGIVTGLASLLFLVNFVVWLDTGEDSPLPTAWALVELLGRHLIGAQLDGFADDPLWDLLAELDGRTPGIPPDVELEAATPLRLPRAWLRRWPSPSQTYVGCWDGERLVIRHPGPASWLPMCPAPRTAWTTWPRLRPRC